MSASQINAILHLWSVSLEGSGTLPPFQNHKEMYKTINHTVHRDIPWSSFSLQYNGKKLPNDVPSWMDTTYEICYCNSHAVIHEMLTNPEFKDHMDYKPYHKYNHKTEKWEWQDFMSGDWAWLQAMHFYFIMDDILFKYLAL
jgi:hypothetical protein